MLNVMRFVGVHAVSTGDDEDAFRFVIRNDSARSLGRTRSAQMFERRQRRVVVRDRFLSSSSRFVQRHIHHANDMSRHGKIRRIVFREVRGNRVVLFVILPASVVVVGNNVRSINVPRRK